MTTSTSPSLDRSAHGWGRRWAPVQGVLFAACHPFGGHPPARPPITSSPSPSPPSTLRSMQWEPHPALQALPSSPAFVHPLDLRSRRWHRCIGSDFGRQGRTEHRSRAERQDVGAARERVSRHREEARHHDRGDPARPVVERATQGTASRSSGAEADARRAAPRADVGAGMVGARPNVQSPQREPRAVRCRCVFRLRCGEAGADSARSRRRRPRRHSGVARHACQGEAAAGACGRHPAAWSCRPLTGGRRQ